MVILVFGAAGMLGTYVCEYFKAISITRKEFDIYENFIKGTLKTELKNIIEKYSPEYIINCAGIINKRIDSQEMFCVNSFFPILLGEICIEKKIGLIHPTTDCVYSGKKGNYSEDDEKDCIDNYGLSKYLGEKMPFSENSRIAVLRVSIIGKDPNSRSLMSWLFENKNKTINGYKNHFWNGITCLEYAKIMRKIISDNNWNGIYHIVPTYKVSKYELCLMISEIYNLNITVNPIDTNFCDRSLVSNKCKLDIKNLYEQIYEMFLSKHENIIYLPSPFSISYKNVIFITSAILGLSVFTPSQRVQQTLETIKTLRTKMPEFKIVLIEITKIDSKIILQFSNVCDLVILCENDTENHNFTKSFGEIYLTVKILQNITNNVEKICKISGRYFLTDTFDLNSLDWNKFNFLKADKCVHSTFYTVPINEVQFMIEFLNKSKNICRSCNDIEHVLFWNICKSKINFLEKLNCKGFYSGGGEYNF